MEASQAAAILPEKAFTGRESTLLLAVGLTSFSTLLIELALTRLFSVVLFYHFAFLAISIALLGLGAGGVFAYVWKQRLAKHSANVVAGHACVLNAASAVLALEVIVRAPVTLELSWMNFGKLTLIYVVAAVPFFFTGLILSLVFARESARITRLYCADLAGGAIACLAFVPLLNVLGGPNAVLLSAVTMLFAAAAWTATASFRKRVLSCALILLVGIAANYSGALVDVIYAKGRRHDRSTGMEYVRWNAISRVEVDGYPNGAKNIIIDADAGTSIMNVDPHAWHGTAWEQNLMGTAPAIVNVLRPRGEFAIIGPGGGVDVLRAVANGSPRVTGIEINPIIATKIMRGRYAEYAYHLYQIPEVQIVVSDGRSFIRNSAEKYDVVQMTLVDTWASTAAGAFALSENNLYTVEAFREYFDHLRPDGMIAITRWEFRHPREALRVVSVAMEALHQLGFANPTRHFLVISEGTLDKDGIPVLVLAKKAPFTLEEEDLVLAQLRQYPRLGPLYLPSTATENPFSALIRSNNPSAFAREYTYNVAPVTDNAPFFFFTLKTGQILDKDLQRGIDWKVNLGVVVLAMVLAISAFAVLAFLVLPLLLRNSRAQSRPLPLLYFVAIGSGYIIVEIALIQRFVLFLGHPTYALTVVIFLLLLSSGFGSLLSRKWLGLGSRRAVPLLVILLGLSLYVFLLPTLLDGLVGLAFLGKLLVSGVLLVPLGFNMGAPFPLGLHALALQANANENAIEWAWAMNAASSVLGSVLAMIIALHRGLNLTLAAGAFSYGLALLLSRTLNHTRHREYAVTPLL